MRYYDPTEKVELEIGYITIIRKKFPEYLERVKKYYKYLMERVKGYDHFYWVRLGEEAKLKYSNLSFLKRLFGRNELSYVRRYREDNANRDGKRLWYLNDREARGQAAVLIDCLKNKIIISSIQLPIWFDTWMSYFEEKQSKRVEI